MLACELWPPGGAWSMGPQKRGETAKPRIYPDLGSFVRVSYGIVCYWDRRGRDVAFAESGVSASRGRCGERAV